MRRIRGARGTGYRLAWFTACWGLSRLAECGRDRGTRSGRWSVVSLSDSLGGRATAGFSRDGRSPRRRRFGPSGCSWCTLFGDSTHGFGLRGVGVAFSMCGGRVFFTPAPGAASAGNTGHRCGSLLRPLYDLAPPFSFVPPLRGRVSRVSYVCSPSWARLHLER